MTEHTQAEKDGFRVITCGDMSPEEFMRHVIDTAPAPTPEQRDVLAMLLPMADGAERP